MGRGRTGTNRALAILSGRVMTQELDRKHKIRVQKPDAYVKQRLAETAQSISRAGDMAAHVELVNEALCNLVTILYQRDSDGDWSNIDRVTYRLLIPAPWGSKGWKLWELRSWEAIVLRRILIERSTDRTRPALFDYNNLSRTWHLNLGDYKTPAAALLYLERLAPVKVDEWRRVSSDWLSDQKGGEKKQRSDRKVRAK